MPHEMIVVTYAFPWFSNMAFASMLTSKASRLSWYPRSQVCPTSSSFASLGMGEKGTDRSRSEGDSLTAEASCATGTLCGSSYLTMRKLLASVST